MGLDHFTVIEKELGVYQEGGGPPLFRKSERKTKPCAVPMHCGVGPLLRV